MAAACCAHLLSQAGLLASWQKIERSRVPVLLLSGSAMTLLGDIFGPLPALAASHRIRRRVVRWGSTPDPVEAEHAAVVVSETFLLDAIAENLGFDASETGDWSILTSPPLPEVAQEEVFGNRMAAAVPVEFANEEDADACWTESVEGGWLFLMPNSARGGYLLAVGGTPEQLLASSVLIAARITLTEGPVRTFPTHPRMHWPLAGSGWLACGSAAMSFDPICGDGTAQAVREAILASAVVRAIATGADPEPLLAHYRGRLAAGMARHLLLCAEFYRSGGDSSWWSAAYRWTTEGAQRCSERVEHGAGFRYRMQGFELQPVA